MIPERSLNGKSASSVFFHDVNDIDIFIEDTAYGYEKIYRKIFSRIFDGKYKVDKVFPLGGCKELLDKWRTHEKNGRPFLYILDGDLYLIIDDSRKCEDGLFVLPCYCIENVLCDPNAISIIMDEESTSKEQKEIDDEFDYSTWKALNEDKLFQLFLLYGLVFREKPEVQTVSFPVKRLIASEKGDIDDDKFSDRINDLKSKFDPAESTTLEKELDGLKKDILKTVKDKLDIVSGKDYLYPLLRSRSDSIVKNKVPHINFKLRLAKHCCIDVLKDCVAHVGS